MELFKNAESVRLKSSHGKYLTAEEDQESVTQDRNGSSKSAKWTVEFVGDSDINNNIIRLKSCYGKYLTASTKPYSLFGISGRRVLQTDPKRLDSSVEWKVIRENGAVKLKTGYGQFLRANGGLPPWRNSITHDLPHRTAAQEWILWEVQVVEILDSQGVSPPVEKSDSFSSETSSNSTLSAKSAASAFSWNEFTMDEIKSPKGISDGRVIYFHIADENGEIEEGFEELCIRFKGNGVEELRKRLEWELGIEGITVCYRSPLNGLLYPLRLQLPPNINAAAMHIVVVPAAASSQGCAPI